MSVVFNNYWADRFWASAGREQDFIRTSKLRMDSLALPLGGNLPAPFCDFRLNANVLVGKALRIPASSKMQLRICQKVPPKSFVCVDSGFYVVSPEFLFLELACRLPIQQLIAVGYELCGSYAIDPETGNARFNLKPVSSVERLTEFIESAKGMHGIKKARRALKYVLENSASPMETASCMRIDLPCMLGGCCMHGMQLNHPVPLSPEAASVYRRHQCFCDIYFPSIKRDLEFHGKYHEDTQDNDWARESALQLMGVNVTPITYAQYRNDRAFMAIVAGIAAELGIKIRPNRFEPSEQKQLLKYQLSRYLQSSDRFQPLLPEDRVYLPQDPAEGA